MKLPPEMLVLSLLGVLVPLLLFAGAVLLFRRWIRDKSRDSSMILFIVTTVFAVILHSWVVIAFPTLMVVLDLLAVLVTLLLFAGALLLLRRWIRDESRASSIILFVLTTLFAVILSRLLILDIILDIERVAAATELGVSLNDQQYLYRFPADYLQERLVEGVTTRAQVHELLKLAKARYQCAWDEKYFFISSSRYKAVILDVVYDGDVYSYSLVEGDSGGLISIESCTLDSDWR